MKEDNIKVRNCGSINYVNSIKGSKNITTKRLNELNEFLTQLSKNLIKRSALYLDNVIEGEPAYAYSEKTFHTILIPAIDLITHKFLIECPIKRFVEPKRKLPGKNGKGWADYWIGYKNIEIFLELKQGSIATIPRTKMAIKAKNRIKQIQDLWNDVNTQLKELEHDATIYQNEMKKHDNCFRIGMLILPFYQWSNLKKDIQKDISFFESVYKEVVEQINPKPNWSGLFLMNSRFENRIMKDTGDKYCYNPGFLMLMNVIEIKRN